MGERVRKTVRLSLDTTERLMWLCSRRDADADQTLESVVQNYLATHGFRIGDRVNYHSIIGGEVTLPDTEILDGPFDMCGHTTWRIRGKSGTVSELALSLCERAA